MRSCAANTQVKCTSNSACSGRPATVVITDECPGEVCLAEAAHFDMSGTSMGAMAKPDMADRLRAAGILKIQYKRVPCKYTGVNIAFRVDQGSNPFYFEVLMSSRTATMTSAPSPSRRLAVARGPRWCRTGVRSGGTTLTPGSR